MPFTVTVRPSGRTFQVQRDEPILHAAIRDSVGLPFGCKDGACGSCKSRLLEGQVIHGVHQHRALSLQEEDAGYILTCCAAPQSDVLIEACNVLGAGEFAPRKMPVRVTTITHPAPDVVILKLQLPASEPLRYHAGQYVEFLLSDGSRRSYSMANAPRSAAMEIELHIRHMPGGKFTDHVFSAMSVKEILRLEGPYGSFYLREDSSKPVLLLASGTGFAPIKAIIEQLESTASERPTLLYWGCHSKVDLYLDDWAQQAATRMPHLRYIPVLSEARSEDHWFGRTGWVHRAVIADLPDLSNYQVYACGAPVMVESARRDFIAQCRLPESEFFADAFTSETDKH